MQKQATFRTYTWLINTIRKAKKITFANINKEWVKTEMSGGLKMYRSTFNRYRDAILDTFGIIIECEPRTYLYYIENDRVLNEDTIQNWMLSTLSVNTIIQESMSLQKRIFLESIPHDQHLEAMVEAMKSSRKVTIRYRKYGSNDYSERTIQPYFLKVFKRRWYVLSKNEKNEFRLFSFDRIIKSWVTEEKFTYDKDFDPKEYFIDTYGVMRDERKEPQRIVLRAFGNEKHYMEDLPVHSSQKIIGKGEGYVDYEVVIRPTTDFIAYIMSRGAWCKVIEPQSLAQEIKKQLQDAAEIYN